LKKIIQRNAEYFKENKIIYILIYLFIENIFHKMAKIHLKKWLAYIGKGWWVIR
jgi:hypothetical protein